MFDDHQCTDLRFVDADLLEKNASIAQVSAIHKSYAHFSASASSAGYQSAIDDMNFS